MDRLVEGSGMRGGDMGGGGWDWGEGHFLHFVKIIYDIFIVSNDKIRHFYSF